MARIIRDFQSLESLDKLFMEELILHQGSTGWTRKTEVFYVLGEETSYYKDVLGGVDPQNPSVADLDGDGLREVHIWVSTPLETEAFYEISGNEYETLHLPHGHIKPGSEKVIVNGQTLLRNTDYFITYRAGVIRFVSAVTGTIQVQYTHGETQSGQVAIPSQEQLENCRDNAFARLWDIPHSEDNRRAVGYERDGIPVIIHIAIEPCPGPVRARQWDGVNFVMQGENYYGTY